MKDEKVGIYAVRVYQPEQNKDILVNGPDKIDFDKQTREFSILLELEDGVKGRKMIELYVRNNPDSIPYKKQTRDRLNLKHVELVLRIPCMIYPDPKYIKEDEIER